MSRGAGRLGEGGGSGGERPEWWRFKSELQELEHAGLRRRISDRLGPQGPVAELSAEGEGLLLNLASNDYLGLAGHPALSEAACRAATDWGAGAGASRLLSGGSALHRRLETMLAAFKETEEALLWGSGFGANTGAIPALTQEGDLILSDERNHASIIDGCRLSRAKTRIYPHLDMKALSGLLEGSTGRRRMVVTDTLFSMEGDQAPVVELIELCGRHGALLYLDEAHATGVLGPGGRGAMAAAGLRPLEYPFVVIMGTCSKALGSYGAFVAASGGIIDWLTNRARSLIYSTALPPSVVGATLAALEVIEREPALMESLRANALELRRALRGAGLGELKENEIPIIAVPARDVSSALEASARLREKGYHAPAIRPPSVPAPQLRLSVTAAHRRGDLEGLSRALGELIKEGLLVNRPV